MFTGRTENTLADLAGAAVALADLPVLSGPDDPAQRATRSTSLGWPACRRPARYGDRAASAARGRGTKLAAGCLPGRSRRRERCVARAQGNPLFLEQLARHLRERDDDSRAGNVQTLIQARLDRLDSPIAKPAGGLGAGSAVSLAGHACGPRPTALRPPSWCSGCCCARSRKVCCSPCADSRRRLWSPPARAAPRAASACSRVLRRHRRGHACPAP